MTSLFLISCELICSTSLFVFCYMKTVDWRFVVVHHRHGLVLQNSSRFTLLRDLADHSRRHRIWQRQGQEGNQEEGSLRDEEDWLWLSWEDHSEEGRVCQGEEEKEEERRRRRRVVLQRRWWSKKTKKKEYRLIISSFLVFRHHSSCRLQRMIRYLRMIILDFILQWQINDFFIVITLQSTFKDASHPIVKTFPCLWLSCLSFM